MITTHTVIYTSPLTVQPTVAHYGSFLEAQAAASLCLLRGQYRTAVIYDDETGLVVPREPTRYTECYDCGIKIVAGTEDDEERPLCGDCESQERQKLERNLMMAWRLG